MCSLDDETPSVQYRHSYITDPRLGPSRPEIEKLEQAMQADLMALAASFRGKIRDLTGLDPTVRADWNWSVRSSIPERGSGDGG